MNGIEIGNPMSLLMNLGIGANSDVTNMSPSVHGVPQESSFDLLGFVDLLEVSQGPKSPMGEDLDLLSEELINSSVTNSKNLEKNLDSSQELLGAMVLQGNAKPTNSMTSNLKIDSKESVGLEADFVTNKISNLDASETLLASDLSLRNDKNFMMNQGFDSRFFESANTFGNKIGEKDIAVWSKAFAANDIKSIDVIEDADTKNFGIEKQIEANKLLQPNSLSELKSNKQKTQGPIFNQKAKNSEPFVSEAVLNSKKNSSNDTSFEPFVATKNQKIETLFAKETNTENDQRPKLKTVVEDSSTVAADFMLGREVGSESLSLASKSVSEPLRLATSIGDTSDSRLSDDSVKMLSDKIESLKESSPTTLRVVVNQSESGNIEIRLRKIGSELKVNLKSDSNELNKMLLDSKPDLIAKLSERFHNASVEVSTDVLRSSTDSLATNSALKSMISSSDLMKIGSSETKVSSSNLTSSENFDFSGSQKHEFQGKEDSRDRGMRKWQSVFDQRESA